MVYKSPVVVALELLEGADSWCNYRKRYEPLYVVDGMPVGDNINFLKVTILLLWNY